MTGKLEDYPGVGQNTLVALAGIGITTLQDLLFHLPLRYEDLTRFTPLNQLKPGGSYLIRAIVSKTEIRTTSRRSLLVWLKGECGEEIVARFFYFKQAFAACFSIGKYVEAYGEAGQIQGEMVMVHPRVSFGETSTLQTETLTPVYPLGKGVTQILLQKLAAEALSVAKPSSLIPDKFLSDFGLLSLEEAVEIIHCPRPGIDDKLVERARNVLVFEEFCAHMAAFARIKKARARKQGIKLLSSGKLVKKLTASLPFMLTAAQNKVIREITTDLASGHPMNRLLQGDVGSGKTIVATIAGLIAVEAGFQCVLMAPTEILASQHYSFFSKWLKPLGVKVAHLTGAMKSGLKNEARQKISAGDYKIIVGTHALFQKEVEFNRLALVIIDEQHRFGVEQRISLRAKSGEITPHQLIMTATPIPRTMAMSYYGYLDYSVIDELPPGRKPVKTSVIADSRRTEVIARIKSYLQGKRQVYWVCPLIEESEALQCQTVIDTASFIAGALPEYKVGMVHGRMKTDEKAEIMRRFNHGDCEVLVATTVIEVGLDVPNAELMVIDNAERLGLSQLHQIRGRVGRGENESYCLLLYKKPLADKARKRLEAMKRSNDGFKIAEYDLEMRGPGDMLGLRQAGELRFKLADIVRDKKIMAFAAGQFPKIYAAMEEKSINELIKRWTGREIDCLAS